MNNLTLENVRIGFRNFAGKEGRFNREGDRNFAVFLDDDLAGRMLEDGWNVKYLKPRDEDVAPQAYIQVNASYNPKARDPRVVMVTSRGRSSLGKDEINILDWADIRNVDLIIRPYSWELADGKSGVKAYLQSIFVTIEEDELELKYANVPDSAQNIVDTPHDENTPPWS
jgi:hypothetical protein